MANRSSSEKIGLRPLLIYAQAQTGLNLCVTLIGLHLLYFYSDRMGLSPSLAGLAFFLALVLDAVTDPLVGNISDRARFKSGRRRPFFFAAIPMAVCYYLLLSPPRLHAGLFVWFFGFYFLMLTSRKIYETAYSALMPELTLDYDERTKLSTFRMLLGTVGDISGALLPFAATYLFARGTDFKVTGAICAIVVAGGAMLAYTGLRERAEFLTLDRSRLWASIKSIGGNRPFIILLIATTLAIMAINIPTVLIRFLAKYWYHDENAAARWLIAYFAGSVVSYPFWFRITVRFEKKPAFVVAMICNAMGSLLFMTMTPQSTVALYILMAFTGFSAIGIWVTQMSASADVIEWDEERTGQRQEGAYGGITSMSIKLAVAVTLLMVGPVLSWVGYKPGGGGITPAAGEHLRALFALGPAAIYLLSALVFSRYPITRASHRAMRDRLIARSAAAEEEKSKAIA
ncbi:MFS transporter [Candidatus Binatus sp.]|uniref:MFS transporter n=1 Tax=Candidatus Binatus sp. TaxID=2811406 RepID=UPI003BB0319C